MKGAQRTELLTAALLVCLAAPFALAQPTGPYLVKNILDQPIATPLSSFPGSFHTLGNLNVFEPSTLPWQIWASDGTEPGTRALMEFCPGSFCNSAAGYSLTHFGSSGDLEYFRFRIPIGTSSSGPFRWELWRTDGTSPGTILVSGDLSFSDPFPPFFSAVPLGSIEPEGILIFPASTPDAGYELWGTDGTVGGTAMIGDLSPGADHTDFFTAYSQDGQVFFQATTPGLGSELWITDGSAAGTRLVRDIRPGPASSSPRLRHALSDAVLFTATDDVHGKELWRTDGSLGGTVLVADLGLGAAGINVISFPRITQGDVFFFVAEIDGQIAQLYVTDGTDLGTRQLTFFASPQAFSSFLPSEEFLPTGSLLYFVADDGLNGRELWTSDGSVLGTSRVTDICPGPCSSEPLWLRPVSGGVLFQADDGSRGVEPWFTDGTALGTRMLGDLCPGLCGSEPNLRRHAGEPGFFTADDGGGRDLWTTDGTLGGTRRLTDLSPLEPFGFPFFPLQIGSVGDLQLISIDDGTVGRELWRSDATPAGTFLLKDLRPNGDFQSVPREILPLGSGIAFVAWDDQNEAQLYVSDGTAPGTVVLTLPNAAATPNPSLLASAGDRLFFYATDASLERQIWVSNGTVAGTMSLTDLEFVLVFAEEIGVLNGEAYFPVFTELWKSDGTPDGTGFLAPVFPAPTTPAGSRYLEYRDRLYFAGDDPGNPDQNMNVLWRTDGTSAGTSPVPSAAGISFTGSPQLTPVGSSLYFAIENVQGDDELWRTDGTSVTEMVALLPAVPGEPRPSLLGAAGNLLLFAAFDPEHGKELWVSDGTAVGTHHLRDLAPGTRSSFLPEGVRQINGPIQISGLGSRLFFVAHDGSHGEELWVSDGTESGTRLVRDIWPGLAGAHIQSLAATDDRLFFAASDGLHGAELWQSDGTAGGTFRLSDIHPGPRSAGVNELTVSGDLLFFRAGTDATNLELWAAPIPASPPSGGIPAPPSALRASALNASTIALSWEDNAANETLFEIEAKTAQSSYALVASAGPETVSSIVGNLQTGLPHTFRVRAVGASGTSPYSNEASATPLDESPGPCTDDDETLCLLQDGSLNRFKVRVHWKDQRSGDFGTGQAVPFDFSEDSGQFWFFDEANIELIVKALDGRTVNGNFWAFYGALSDVEYWITVTDTGTNINKTYHNVPGDVCGLGDVAAFPGSLAAPASSPAVSLLPAPALPASAIALPGTSTGACGPTSTDLCLLDSRFRVDVSWRDQRSGDTGLGMAIPGTSDSGFFWFFDQTNVELVVKVLDGRPVNGHLWVFYGGLSDVEYTITVQDTETGAVKTYFNEPGNICGQADVTAF